MPTSKKTKVIIPEPTTEVFKDLEVSGDTPLEKNEYGRLMPFYDLSLRPEYHPISNIEPMMKQEKMNDLVIDMKTNGYMKGKPIVMYEGKILDGRNRTVASGVAGVTPDYITFTGTYAEAMEESRRLNNLRRHKSKSQEAMAAAYAIKANEAQRDVIAEEIKALNPAIGKRKLSNQITQNCGKVSNAIAAKHQGCSVKSVENAKTLLRCDEALAHQVFIGDLSITEGQKRHEAMEKIRNKKTIGDGELTPEEVEKFKEMDAIENDPEAAYLKLKDKDETIADLNTRVKELSVEVEALKETIKSMEEAPVKSITETELAHMLKELGIKTDV